MTLDDAIVAFGQVASDDFDSLELDVRDYERLVMWLTELKLARESVFSDIGLAARATSENHQLKSENAKLRELCEWLLTPYRLGAVTGEGVDKQWCRETYDGGSYRLRELGVDE